MKKHLPLTVFVLLFIFSIHVPVFCEKNPQRNSSGKDYIILVPAGKTMNKFPVLKPLPKSDPRYLKAKHLFENTFIAESVLLYKHLQQYLANSGEKKEVEPAYLLLSRRQGGFPLLGFYLQENGTISDKRTTWYIDMADLDKNSASLSSLTQIFPHEMGHVYFSLLAPEARKNYDASSTDMHFFSMTTNYLTAFNEGFAEHIENAARIYEPDSTIKAGTEKDTRRLSDRLPHRINGLDRDFRFPLRLGYYRAGLLLWYQGFEDYKRYQWAMAGNAFFKNKTLSSGNIEKNILYRNAGLGFDDNQLRNPAQLASNEGVINSFFTHLLLSSVKDRYMPEDFYLPFLTAKDAAGFVAKRSLTSLQNYYLKLFTVLHRQMNHPAGDTSFLQLFVGGWERQFPEEKEIIETVYRKTTGNSFMLHPVPEIWLMNEKQGHSILVMDQFGGNTIPFYTMNLNTAEESDLAGFRGIAREEILNLIRYREKNLGFQSVNDLNKAGLSQKTVKTLVDAHQLMSKPPKELEESGMSIANIFIYNGGHILLIGLLHFAIFCLLFYVLFMHKAYSPGKILIISVQKFFKFYLLIVLGLICFMFSPLPVLPFLGLMICILITDWLKSRRKVTKRREIFFTTLYMSVVVIYSLI